MKIKTDNKTRLLLNWEDLTPSEQGEFDWFSPEDSQGDFVRYRGLVYLLDEFLIVENENLKEKGWQGFEPSSAFSATLVKYSEHDNDYVIMGTVCY